MKAIAFKTKTGNLTAYSFRCGYVQCVRTETLDKELYMEFGMYHVRSTINNSPELHTVFDGPHSHKFVIWEGFETLKDARKLYTSIK